MTTHPKSKKWVDYSDSDSPDQFSPAQNPMSPPRKPQKIAENLPQPNLKRYVPSKSEVNDQLDLLDDLDYRRTDEVWLDIFSENLDYLQKQMEFLGGKAKKGGNVVKVNSTEDPCLFSVLVYIEMAYDYVKNGYDPDDYLKVTVADRNFERRGNNRGTGREEKSKKYVKKQSSQKTQEKPEKSQKREKYESLQESSFKKEKYEDPKQKEEIKPEKKEKKKKKQVSSKYASNNPFAALEDI